MKKGIQMILITSVLALLTGCGDVFDFLLNDDTNNEQSMNDQRIITPLDELTGTDIFQDGALEHILEGELNRKGSAVGYHYDHLPTKKGEIIQKTKTEEDSQGVYEAKVIVDGVEKTSNRGRSSFFPDDWDSQDVVNAIREAYEHREYLEGNTYEGLTKDGIIVQMYLNGNNEIISAFPVYEGE